MQLKEHEKSLFELFKTERVNEIRLRDAKTVYFLGTIAFPLLFFRLQDKINVFAGMGMNSIMVNIKKERKKRLTIENLIFFTFYKGW